MGWFVLACILGFSAYWWGDRLWWRWPIPVWIVGGIILGFLCWLFLVGKPSTLARFVADVGDGSVARFCLGFLLGVCSANAVWHGSAVNWALTLPALGVVLLLGLTAPHLDRWFRQLSGLKAPVIEIQLATTASARHQVAVTEISQAIANQQALKGLGKYDLRIRQDIEFMRLFEIPDLQDQMVKGPGHIREIQEKIDVRRKRLADAQELLVVFEGLLSPIAQCVDDAIGKGLNVGSVRVHVRPIADLLQVILFNESKAELATEISAAHEEFWTRVMHLPEDENIRLFLLGLRPSRATPSVAKEDKKECLQYPKDYPEKHNFFPRVQDFHDMPYLYAGAAYLFSFMGDNDAAASLLRRVTPEFKDYVFLSRAGQLLYYQGAPVSFSIPYLEEMRDTAHEHLEIIRRMEARCKNEPCEQKDEVMSAIDALRKREREAELKAMNAIAYVIAEDLARGIASAEPFRAIADDHAEKIYDAVQKGEYDDEKDSLTDTYAYVSLVLESRKSTPDIERLRELIRIFERVAESQERSIQASLRDRTPVSTADLTYVRITRGHLAAAHDLAGE